jgi:hypothetical protein|tara:strand:+ start:10147 stop:10317 length:171 start_codon:yes stop_codon:yes gene_type:complete
MGLEKLFGKNFYEVKTRCSNCSTKQNTKITKGNVASEVIENGACINCGCKNLEIIK